MPEGPVPIPSVTLEVLRYQPALGATPYVQRWEVPAADGMSVLEALQHVKDHLDGSLAYRWSCRMAICGSCGVMVNGVPRLACRTFMRDLGPGPVRIEALAHFPIERDLVVDMGDFIDKLSRVQPWIVPGEPRALEAGPHLQSPAQLERFESFSHCINCLLCYAACPQYGLEPSFLGPAATTLLHRYNLDSRDAGRAQRMELVHAEEGVWSCTAVGYCSEVCPKAVDPAAAMNNNKSASAAAWFARWLRRGD